MNRPNPIPRDLDRFRHARFGTLTEIGKIYWMIAVHIALAFLMRSFPFVGTLHALIVFGIACWKALTEEDLQKLIPITAYIIGAEVLWRMNKANIFWEFGKYAIVAIFILALLRRKRLKNGFLPVLLFLLLIPSIFLTIDAFGIGSQTRDLVSFNLSGLLATSVCFLFFSQVKINASDVKNWVWPLIYPVMGILALAIYSTVTATVIEFTSESLFVTSGGYGPNQVSAMLGLAALLLIMLAMTEKQQGRILAILLSLVLLTQSFLTFSRGGVYNFGIALTLATLILLRKPDNFIRGVFVVSVIVLVASYFIIPTLEEFTGGLLVQRFLDLDTTGRIELAKADLKLFQANPILGVGPGMASYVRTTLNRIAPHTEYTRLLSEHGLGGVLALVVMAIILLRSYLRAKTPMNRAWVVGLAAWSLVEMGHAAMRIAAIAYLLGLAAMQWGVSQEKEIANEMAVPVQRGNAMRHAKKNNPVNW
jgi:hypothetical protein